MKKVEFLLPSVPAPIGGFKVVYHQARILKRAGYAVNVQHVNVVKKDRRFIKKYISILNFLRRKYFDIWKYYPKYYDLDYSVSNEINQKEDINL